MSEIVTFFVVCRREQVGFSKCLGLYTWYTLSIVVPASMLAIFKSLFAVAHVVPSLSAFIPLVGLPTSNQEARGSRQYDNRDYWRRNTTKKFEYVGPVD